MVAKSCPRCGKRSYSAVTKGEWICPYCGLDLTELPNEPLTVRGTSPEVSFDDV